jgi:cobalt-zinc-cadmium efflux system outer membrane protein
MRFNSISSRPSAAHGATRHLARTGWVLALLSQLCTAQAAAPLPTSDSTAQPKSTQVSSPPELGAEQLISVILAHNTPLLAAQNARVAAQSGIQAAQALPNPRLDWSQGRNTARLPGVTPGPLQSWSVSQLIENPAARRARIDMATATEQESTQLLRLTRHALVSEARLRIYQGLLHQAQAEATADDVQLLEQVRERVRLRVASGEAARYEIIKADAEIITARERLQTARLMVEQNKIQLNQMAAGQLPAQWHLLGDLKDAPDLLDLDQLHQLVMTHNPELSLLQAEVSRAQALLRSAQSSRWPGVEVRYAQSQDAEFRQGQWGIGMQIPLLDQRSGPIAQASAELARAQVRLDGRKAELKQEVLLTWKSLEMARLRIEALSQGSVREAEAALRVAQAAYRFGERGILDVLDAQRVLRSVRADLIQARYQLQEARIKLDQLIGQNMGPAPV